MGCFFISRWFLVSVSIILEVLVRMLMWVRVRWVVSIGGKDRQLRIPIKTATDSELKTANRSDRKTANGYASNPARF